MTDEELSKLSAYGDERAAELLVKRYTQLVRVCARPLFLMGGDGEDLIQEGMLGLLSAIREYDGSRGAAFRTFAEACIRNRLRSAVRSARRSRHLALNESVSLDETLIGTEDFSRPGPEETVIDSESLSERLHALRSLLSPLERKVLVQYLDGFSYADIALATRRSTKSVDNAVQRIRRKLARHTMFGDFSVS